MTKIPGICTYPLLVMRHSQIKIYLKFTNFFFALWQIKNYSQMTSIIKKKHVTIIKRQPSTKFNSTFFVVSMKSYNRLTYSIEKPYFYIFLFYIYIYFSPYISWLHERAVCPCIERYLWWYSARHCFRWYFISLCETFVSQQD